MNWLKRLFRHEPGLILKSTQQQYEALQKAKQEVEAKVEYKVWHQRNARAVNAER